MIEVKGRSGATFLFETQAEADRFLAAAAKMEPRKVWQMEGLKVGRIVYVVLSASMVDEIMRRRTDGRSIADRIAQGQWPIGAQAHIGAAVEVGQIVPAMVTAVGMGQHGDVINAKCELDGSDSYWARAVPYDVERSQGSWGWMFDGQANRYDASKQQ